jgi:hypothetical protein
MGLDGARGVTAPRIVVRGATLSITRRTTFRKAFLAPWHPLVAQIWKYELAYIQHKYGLELHMAALVLNHHHIQGTLREANLGEILHRLHHDISCAINTLLKYERYDAPKELWDKRSTHVMRDLDAEAQASSASYMYANAVAAGLVDRPEHMPGGALHFGLWRAGGEAVKRPDIYLGKGRPSELELRLSPSPVLMQAFDGDIDALVHHMRRVSEEAIRAIHKARKGRAPMGPAKLCDLHPWMEPRTLVESGGGSVPAFKVGARGLIGKRIACDAAREVTGWRYEHEETRQARLAIARGEALPEGACEPVFPYGTYGARVFHGAPVAEQPMPGAIVAAPGPLLEEVMAEIAARRGQPSDVGARRRVLDEVRAAWAEEASEVAEHESLDFDETTRPRPRADATSEGDANTEADADNSSSQPDADAKTERPEPEVRHRFDPDEDHAGRPHPRRLITKRDRRRRKLRKRGRSDPPA